MRRYFLVAVFLTATSISAASAADLAPRIFTKAPPAPDNWSGGYVGVSGGFGTGNSKQTDPGPGPLASGGGGGGDDGPAGDGSYSVNGGLIGGTIGYNWQAARWVYGVEGDFSWADISGHSDLCGLSAGAPHPCGTRLSSLGTLRGRVGYAAGATENWLLYATGGLAVGEVRGWDSTMPASGSELRPGWTVGAGVETKFAPNWSAKVEYLYVNLGKSALFDILPSTPETVSFDAHIVRAGINYKLSPGKMRAAGLSAEPAGNWTGFYIGAHVGGGSAGSNWAFQRDPWPWSEYPHTIPFGSKTGLLGGAQAGFNYQLGSVVAGVEGTWSGLNHKQAIISPYYPSSDTETTKINNIVTIAGRLGVTWDRLLFYGKGGWAGGEVELSAASTSGGAPTTWTPGSKFRNGVIVGAGIEYMLTQDFILGVEYNHIDLGRANYTASNVGNDTSLTSADDKTKLDTVVGRLSYKFAPSGFLAGR